MNWGILETVRTRMDIWPILNFSSSLRYLVVSDPRHDEYHQIQDLAGGGCCG